jgi:mannose-1-phosphate guanylyltransferase
MCKSDNLHAIILASGEDPRLGSLAEALSGAYTPKQFAVIAGGGSLLQQTVARYAGHVRAEHMVVVVASAQEALARAQLREWPGIDLVTRPAECGEGLDLLLSLGRVFSRSPDARVVVTPADHYVPRPEPFVNSEWTSTQDVIDSLEDRKELDLLLSRILARQRAAGRTELRRRAQASHANAA